MRPSSLLWTSLLALTPVLGAQDPAERAPLLDHKRMRVAIRRVAGDHPEVASGLLLGNSRGGLEIEALRLAAGDLGGGRPALLVVGGLEGPQAWTSGLVLELARELARDYGNDADVTALLDSTTVYLVPRANPDACEARFLTPLREARASGPGGDEDRDSRLGEDGPQDIDGDGVVGWMRVPDPLGTWIPDEVDPRVLVEVDRDQGKRGRWRLVREGLDADGDGEVAEDPPLDAEVNRNFAAGFEEHTPRAGRFATAEPETRALCDFVLSHRDIQLVLVYGELDTTADPPEGVPDDAADERRVPPAGPRTSDAAILSELARRYRESSGDEAAGDGDDDAGTFSRWCYEHRGLATLAIDAWAIPLEEEEGGDGSQPSEPARRLAWLEARGVDAHLGWRAFAHPSLGPVEVGGFRPYAQVEPPAAERAALVDGQRAFLVGLSDALARVELAQATWTDLGGGTIEVRATVVNDGLLPLLGTWGRRTRTTRPARVELRLPEGARLLAGERVHLVSELGGLGGRHELRWLVRGAPPHGGVGVEVVTDHAGSARRLCEEASR